MQYANTIGKNSARWVNRFAEDFAFAASGIYPELQWSLIDGIIARDSLDMGGPPRLVTGGGDPPAPRPRRSVPLWIAWLAALPGLLWQRLRREREMWRNMAELQTLDDRTLSDIGLSRCEIEFIAGGRHRWRC